MARVVKITSPLAASVSFSCGLRYAQSWVYTWNQIHRFFPSQKISSKKIEFHLEYLCLLSPLSFVAIFILLTFSYLFFFFSALNGPKICLSSYRFRCESMKYMLSSPLGETDPNQNLSCWAWREIFSEWYFSHRLWCYRFPGPICCQQTWFVMGVLSFSWQHYVQQWLPGYWKKVSNSWVIQKKAFDSHQFKIPNYRQWHGRFILESQRSNFRFIFFFMEKKNCSVTIGWFKSATQVTL
jgi:hypothetical protein